MIKKPELLAEDETIEDHAAMVEEHEQLVKNDRESSKGLFHGLFRSRNSVCPACCNVMYHGVCTACGYNVYEDESEGFSDPEGYGFDGLSDYTDLDEQDEDFDMEDAEHGFDGVLDEDVYGMPGWNTNEEDPIPPDQQHAMIHRYLTEIGRHDPSLSAYTPMSHGMAGNRIDQRRSYAASTVSDVYDTEMNTVLEEDEEEDEDDAPLASRVFALNRSSVPQSDDSVDDTSTDTQAPSELDPSASESESDLDDTSEEASESQSPRSTFFTRTIGLQHEYPSTASETSSITSSQPPQLDSRAATDSTSRRRRRDSNTPSSSIGQPRQRRRIGSAISLATINAQQASAASTNSSTRTESSSDTQSETSENADDDDEASDTTSEDTVNGYVSLGDENGEEDSDGAETTVGWDERSRSPPSPPQQSRHIRARQIYQARLISNTRSSIQPRSSALHDENIDTEAASPQPIAWTLASRNSRQSSTISASNHSANHVTANRSVSQTTQAAYSAVPTTPRQPSDTQNEAIQESHTANSGMGEIGSATSRRALASTRHVDYAASSAFYQPSHFILAGTRTPIVNFGIDNRRGISRTPGSGSGRPRSVNRSRTTTPSQINTPASPSRADRNRAREVVAVEHASSRESRREQSHTSNHTADRVQLAQTSSTIQPLPVSFNTSPQRNRAVPSHFISPGIFATLDELVERTDSRTGRRPPSAAGRRTPLARTALGLPAQLISPGLNTARNWQAPHNSGNPFMRHRTSRRQLVNPNLPSAVRSVPSITALRTQGSRGNIRNNAVMTSGRPPSRTQSRNQAHALNHTPSMIHLPQSEFAQQTSPRYRTVVPSSGSRSVAEAIEHSHAGGIHADSRNESQVPDDLIGRRISNAMVERAASIARRQNLGESIVASNQLGSARHLTELETLRLTSTNPFRGQQLNTSTNRLPPTVNQGHVSYNYTSHLVGGAHAQRLIPRRSRANLGQGLPNDVASSVNNASTNATTANLHALAESTNTIFPRLLRQRSRGVVSSNHPSQITTGHHASAQDRWGAPTSQIGAAGGIFRPEQRLGNQGMAAPRA